jgi:hypothetical protein
MEKAMNAAMTTPPTVPPTMRMVLVLTPPLEDEDEVACARAVDDAVDDVTGSLAVEYTVLSAGKSVGTGVELPVVLVTCVFAVATRAALTSLEELVTGTGLCEVVGASVGVSGVDVVEGVSGTIEVVGTAVVDGTAGEVVTTTTGGVLV